MRLLEVIDKVNDYYVGDDELIWRDNEVLLNRKLVFEGDVVLINCNESIIVLQTESSGTIVIDRITGSQYKIGKSGPIISTDLLLFGKWNEDYSARLLYAWNFRSNTKEWESENSFGNTYLSDGNLFGSLKSILFKIDSSTGDFIWQYNLSEKHSSYSINGEDAPIDVQGYIGVYSGCLYIKAGNKLILGIDVNSGEEKFCFEYVSERVLLDNLRLDMSKGVIFSIGLMEYFELDLSSHQSEVIPIKVSDINTTKLGSWESNIVYFWEGGANSNFGLFDRDSKEVKVVQNLNVSGYPAIKDIKHSKGKVYVLDGNNSLHIFQRE